MAPVIHQNFAVEQIPVPERQAKPRSARLTMMIDWGMPLGLQEDCLESQGLYGDEAKMAAGIPRVMPANLLKMSPTEKNKTFVWPE